MSEGQQLANHYPLSKLWIETEIARERVNSRITTEISLMHSAVIAVMSPDGKGTTNLQNQLRRMNDG